MAIDGSFTDKYRQVIIAYLPVKENVILHCYDKFPQGTVSAGLSSMAPYYGRYNMGNGLLGLFVYLDPYP